MSYTSQKLNFQSYTNGVSPHIGRAADGEREGYWYIGTHCTDVKAEGANARVILLDNDFDIIAINPLGEVVGTLPTVTAMVCEGDDPVLGQTITLSLPTNPTWIPGEHFYYYGNADGSGQIIFYTLKILKLPTGFTSGAFTFRNGVITKKFNLSTITSEKDYNIVIDRTLINSTLDGGTVYITVNEIDSTGTKIYDKDIQGKLELKGVTSSSGESWAVQYTKGQTTPIELTLKVKIEGHDDLITWDKEVIEFVADGAPGVSYWIMRDTPVIAKAADGSYITTSVTFTPMMQVGNDAPKVCTSDDNVAMKIWADNDSEVQIKPNDNGEYIVYLAESDNSTEADKVKVESALYCQMLLNDAKIDEETVEVLKDGVTVTKIKYAVLNQAGGDPPNNTNWVDKIPENIEKGKYLWTKTTYSNNMVAYTSSYQSSDGTHGDDSELVYAYYVTSEQTINIPDKPDGQPSLDPIEKDWWLTNHDLPVDETFPYLYICEGTKKTTYTDNNATTTYTWSTPKLHKAWHESGIDPESYAAFLTTTNFGKQDALYWSKENNTGNLYINASYIKAGLLEVTKDGETANADKSNVLLYAGWGKDTGEGKVQIAGWDVNTDSISKEGLILYSGDDLKYSSLTGQDSVVRIAAGYHITETKTLDATSSAANGGEGVFTIYHSHGMKNVDDNGLKIVSTECEVSGAKFEGVSIRESFQGQIVVTGRVYRFVGGAKQYVNNAKVTITIEYSGYPNIPAFQVLDDGSLISRMAYFPDGVSTYSLRVGKWWHFEEQDIWSESSSSGDTYRTTLCRPSDSTVFGVKKTNNSTGSVTWPFSISRDGTLYATKLTAGRCDIEHQYNGQPYRLSITTGTGEQSAILYIAYDDTNGESKYNFIVRRSGYLYTQGDIKAKGTITQNDSSDARIKNSIETLPLQYDVFFDNMKPCRYKYNAGESNRYHTGYIAQELVQALEDAGLTTQDFAGVMLEEPGTENECWYLRRDEFVALNTWQIQKLKPRMSAAEEKIKLLEEKIQSLENEIESLKNI